MAQAATKSIVLEVDSRSVTGTSACRRLRAGGKIPGNVYGLDRPPFKVAVSPRRIDEVLRLGSGVNTVFQLSLAGEKRTREAMIKELQRDPVSGDPIHVDFVRIDPTKKVQVSVPVRLVGVPEGVRNEFFWSKAIVADRPCFVLTHRMSRSDPRVVLIAERRFYVGHSYNSLHVVMGAIPTAQGVLLFYRNRTFSDQVVGRIGRAKKVIGRRRQRSAVIDYLEGLRDSLKQVP